MALTIIENACVFDGFHDELSENVPPHSDFLESLICFGNVPAHWIESHPNLEWIQLISVGFVS